MASKPRADVVLAKSRDLLARRAAVAGASEERKVDREHAARMLTQADPVEQLRAVGMVRLQAPIWLSVADLTYLRELADTRDCLVGDIVRECVEQVRASNNTTVVED